MIPVLMTQENTAVENSLAWESALSALPAHGGTLILPDGELHHNGLELVSRQDVTVRGEGGRGLRTSLVCDDPRKSGLSVRDCKRITLSGFYSGHSVPSDQTAGAISLHNFSDVTLDSLSTWKGQMWGEVSNSYNGVVLFSDTVSGIIKVINCTLNQHTGTGLYIQAPESGIIAELYIFDNVLMDNSGVGMQFVGTVAGVYVSRNSMWHNGTGIKSVRAYDIFLTENIVDSSINENFLAQNSHSGHLKANWFSWNENGVNVDVSGQIGDVVPIWEISDNIFLSKSGPGLRFGLYEARIHNNTIKGHGVQGPGIVLTESSKHVSVLLNWIKGHSPPIQDLGTSNVTNINSIF
jgi:hypothetical protein